VKVTYMDPDADEAALSAFLKSDPTLQELSDFVTEGPYLHEDMNVCWFCYTGLGSFEQEDQSDAGHDKTCLYFQACMLLEERQRMAQKRPQGEHGMKNQGEVGAIVRFFKDGDHMGIQTTALDERDFVDGCAEGLAAMIGRGEFEGDWEFQLHFWLPQIVDIVCKLRGYKSSVHEQRVITAGYANFANHDLVYPKEANGSGPPLADKA
jgi:hypothetical protein